MLMRVHNIMVAIPAIATLFNPSVPETFSVANLISTWASTKKNVPNNKGHLLSSLVGICTELMDLLDFIIKMEIKGNRTVQLNMTMRINLEKAGLITTKSIYLK